MLTWQTSDHSTRVALPSVAPLIRARMDQIQQYWHRYDAAVSHFVFDTLYRLGYDEAKRPASPSTRGLPFIDSPTLQVTFVLGYLLIVLLGYAKHSLAPSRQRADPFWLKTLVQLHNVNLILLSLYMSYTAASLAWKYSYRFWGQGYRSSERDMGHIVYVFYVSKLYEFVDTVSNNYAGAFVLCNTYLRWIIAYGAPGGDAWYSTFLNSFVHVIMYTYYLLSTIIGKDTKKKAKYLWWGRYLTQFQMFQFVTMITQAGYTWLVSPYPKFLSGLLFVYMISLLALFANFYRRKHGGKSRAPRKKTA